ncbi:nuclear transport factor 2 family protein [Nocardioides sp. Bht2]|uniref:nuclear transport factor 2 family protein n=1 Tax=Nocardioides sp. Bht2 TaxID=3392297 RepID=UPI0039B40583
MEAQMTNVELQERLRAVEAQLEIMQVIASYGPAVDAGEAEQVADLFADDARYSYSMGSGETTLSGREGLIDMVHGPMHQEIITGGAGHVMGQPRIVVEGERAVATCHSMLVRYESSIGRWYVYRLAANRWEFAKTAAGWRVAHRVNRLLDGRLDARVLLGEAPSLDLSGSDQSAC